MSVYDSHTFKEASVLSKIGSEAGIQQCRSKEIVKHCTSVLEGHRCRTSLGAVRDAGFRHRSAEEKLSSFEGNPWIDACECYVQCIESPDCVAFDNFNNVCRMYSVCDAEDYVSPVSGTSVWFVNATTASSNELSENVCVEAGFSLQYFDENMLLFGLVLSILTNVILTYLQRKIQAMDEQSWLASHWHRMLTRDKVKWNNPRTFHVAGKITRFQDRLKTKIAPRSAGILERIAGRLVPAMFAGYITSIIAHMLRLAVYLPFVVWNYGYSLGTVPDLGVVGNTVARRIFSFPDCSFGALSLFSWLLLTDFCFRHFLDFFK